MLHETRPQLTNDEPVPKSLAHRISDRIGPGSVSVVRTGDRTFEGLNERGSVIRIAM